MADAPGDWFDNPAFKSLHTQDPRTTMDDRFDIHFASGEFFDGVGLEYVANSFHVFGNNGTHTLDLPITTGTGASLDVLERIGRRPAIICRWLRTTSRSFRRRTCGSPRRAAARR